MEQPTGVAQFAQQVLVMFGKAAVPAAVCFPLQLHTDSTAAAGLACTAHHTSHTGPELSCSPESPLKLNQPRSIPELQRAVQKSSNPRKERRKICASVCIM